jgi:hypothetical protein
MSQQLGTVRGKAHKFTVSVSGEGIELATWKNDIEGLSDRLTPTLARSLAALLDVAADEFDRQLLHRKP